MLMTTLCSTILQDRLVELLGCTVAKYKGFDSTYDEVSLLIHVDDNALLYNQGHRMGGTSTTSDGANSSCGSVAPVRLPRSSCSFGSTAKSR